MNEHARPYGVAPGPAGGPKRGSPVRWGPVKQELSKPPVSFTHHLVQMYCRTGQ